MMILNYIHLSVSLISTYCILTTSCFFHCVSLIGILFYMDYILHYSQIIILKPDVFIHHLFGLSIIHYMYNHREFFSYENKEIVDFLKNVLSVEISNIFLALMCLLKRENDENKNTIIQEINNYAFVSSFFYIRIYHYTRYIIFSEEVYYIIIITSKHPIHLYSMFIGIYGLGILNYYWFCIIIQKLVSKIQQQ